MSEVKLAVYDLSRGMARAFSQALLGTHVDGIWHTGVVVFGKEYYFGGGVKSEPFGAFSQQQGLPYSSLDSLGNTSKSEGDLRAYLGSVAHRFTAQTYNLLTHNCNNFSNEVIGFLLGKTIPSFILDLPRIALSSPNGAMIRNLVEGISSSINTSGIAMDFDIPFGGAPVQLANAASTGSSAGVGGSHELFAPVADTVVGRVLGGQASFETPAAFALALKVSAHVLSTPEGISATAHHVDAALALSLSLINNKAHGADIRRAAASMVLHITRLHVSGHPSEPFLWGVPSRHFRNGSRGGQAGGNDNSHLQNSCVEILCAAFERYGEESDLEIRQMKLETVLTIVKKLGALCAEFLREMDYLDLLRATSRAGVSAEEAAAIEEILKLSSI